MGWTDRFVAFFSPEKALFRMRAKQRLVEFGYNDSPWRRGDSGGMSKNASSESWAKNGDRMKAMWDARDLTRYDWIGGALGRVALYVVGNLECKSNTGDAEIDKAYDDYLHAWAGDETDDEGCFPCDFTGRHRLSKLIQLAFLAMLVDGDFGFVIRETQDAEGKPQIKLQCVEADRIGSPIDALQSDTYISGFTIDQETGRIVSVRVYQRTRMGQYVKPEEVTPQDFIHLWDPERTDQYRGVTALLRLLNDARDIRETLEAEKAAIKEQAQFAAFVTTKDPNARNGADAWEETTKNGTKMQKAEYGKVLTLAEGEGVSFANPAARPSGSFMAFMQLVIRKMAVSLGLSFGFLWDLSMLGGVSQRVEVRSDERRIQYWQRNLIDRCLRRIRRVVLAYGVARGEIPAHPNMAVCAWHFGERVITDAGYEVQNDLAMMQASVVAWDDVATKYGNGSNLRDIMRRNVAAVRAAQQEAAEGSVPIELFAPGLMPNATQLLAAMNTSPEEVNPPPPTPGSLEAVGEKGAAQIVDLLTKVATGQMDPESAVQTLVTVYGLYPDQARKIVPSGPTKAALTQTDKE